MTGMLRERLLISPDCQSGEHEACAGDPCECPDCHTSGEPGVAP